jgi:hypothetical protein
MKESRSQLIDILTNSISIKKPVVKVEPEPVDPNLDLTLTRVCTQRLPEGKVEELQKYNDKFEELNLEVANIRPGLLKILSLYFNSFKHKLEVAKGYTPSNKIKELNNLGNKLRNVLSAELNGPGQDPLKEFRGNTPLSYGKLFNEVLQLLPKMYNDIILPSLGGGFWKGQKVEFELIKVNYPTNDPNILSQMIGFAEDRQSFKRILSFIFTRTIVKNPSRIVSEPGSVLLSPPTLYPLLTNYYLTEIGYERQIKKLTKISAIANSIFPGKFFAGKVRGVKKLVNRETQEVRYQKKASRVELARLGYGDPHRLSPYIKNLNLKDLVDLCLGPQFYDMLSLEERQNFLYYIATFLSFGVSLRETIIKNETELKIYRLLLLTRKEYYQVSKLNPCFAYKEDMLIEKLSKPSSYLPAYFDAANKARNLDLLWAERIKLAEKAIISKSERDELALKVEKLKLDFSKIKGLVAMSEAKAERAKKAYIAAEVAKAAKKLALATAAQTLKYNKLRGVITKAFKKLFTFNPNLHLTNKSALLGTRKEETLAIDNKEAYITDFSSKINPKTGLISKYTPSNRMINVLDTLGKMNIEVLEDTRKTIKDIKSTAKGDLNTFQYLHINREPIHEPIKGIVTLKRLFPGYLSGVKIRLAGRIMSQSWIPRISMWQYHRGSLARVKVNFREQSRFTGKNKRGAFSFTVTTSAVMN